MKQKTYVIGDVHGCYHTLLELLEKLENDSRIIFVGDLIDRGLYSKDVVDLVIKNKYECILGNHDSYMIKYAKEALDGVKHRWITEDYMGGKETMESYKNDHETLFKHIKFLETLPTYILIDKYFITHGFGLPYFNKRDNKEFQWSLLINREDSDEKYRKDWDENWENHDVINIFGHTDYQDVKEEKNYFGIDTGCAYGLDRKLTAIELGSMKTIQVNTNKKDIRKK